MGIVSERDIVRKCCSREDMDIKLATVSEIMSSPVITINHKSSPREGELLVKNKIRHLLVVDDNGRRIGTITPMDFTR